MFEETAGIYLPRGRTNRMAWPTCLRKLECNVTLNWDKYQKAITGARTLWYSWLLAGQALWIASFGSLYITVIDRKDLTSCSVLLTYLSSECIGILIRHSCQVSHMCVSVVLLLVVKCIQQAAWTPRLVRKQQEANPQIWLFWSALNSPSSVCDMGGHCIGSRQWSHTCCLFFSFCVAYL